MTATSDHMSEKERRCVTAADIEARLTAMRDEAQQAVLCRFFKTAPGEYGEHDEFLGIRVPQTRAVVKELSRRVSDNEIVALLHSRWHEVRLAGLLLLAAEMKAAAPRRSRQPAVDAARRLEIAGIYLANARQADNWDLVDLSAPAILGTYLLHPGIAGEMPSRGVLDRLAASDSLWEQRIAIVSTLALIRAGEHEHTLRISTMLLDHRHDLIHKAVGWMLRELGKRDRIMLETYLAANYRRLPRTTLRYAIERFTPDERQAWLRGPRRDVS